MSSNLLKLFCRPIDTHHQFVLGTRMTDSFICGWSQTNKSSHGRQLIWTTTDERLTLDLEEVVESRGSDGVGSFTSETTAVEFAADRLKLQCRRSLARHFRPVQQPPTCGSGQLLELNVT